MTAPANIAVVRNGFVILYHQGEDNRCPGCGQAQWTVGRSTAECAFCATALPLASPVDTIEREIVPAEPPTPITKEGSDHATITP